MTIAAVRIRPERAGDEVAIRAIHDAAFGGATEGRIVDAIRSSPDFLPDLSLVAEAQGGELAGHVLVSRASLERPAAPAARLLVLGPIGVRPDLQHRGIGATLMRAAIGAAVARAEPVLCLLGHPTYYPRFGFEPARAMGLEPPAAWSDEAWMALRLPAWTPDLRGRVRLPAAFPLH